MAVTSAVGPASWAPAWASTLRSPTAAATSPEAISTTPAATSTVTRRAGASCGRDATDAHPSRISKATHMAMMVDASLLTASSTRDMKNTMLAITNMTRTGMATGSRFTARPRA